MGVGRRRRGHRGGRARPGAAPPARRGGGGSRLSRAGGPAPHRCAFRAPHRVLLAGVARGAGHARLERAANDAAGRGRGSATPRRAGRGGCPAAPARRVRRAGGGDDPGAGGRWSAGSSMLEPDGAPYAWAGRRRSVPVPDTAELHAVITPFYVTLEAWRQAPNGRQAIGTVLLDAAPAVADRGGALSVRFARDHGVALRFDPPGAAPRDSDEFEFCAARCDASPVLFSVRPVPPSQGDAKLAALAHIALRAGIALAVVLALLLFAAPPGRWRWVVALAAAWTAARGLFGPALFPPALFSPATFYRPLLGEFSDSAGSLLALAVVWLLAAGALWRRGVRRRWWTLLLAGLLLVYAPYLVRYMGRGIAPPATGVSFSLWLSWEAALASASMALVLLAAALVRGPAEPRARPLDDPRRLRVGGARRAGRPVAVAALGGVARVVHLPLVAGARRRDRPGAAPLGPARHRDRGRDRGVARDLGRRRRGAPRARRAGRAAARHRARSARGRRARAPGRSHAVAAAARHRGGSLCPVERLAARGRGLPDGAGGVESARRPHRRAASRGGRTAHAAAGGAGTLRFLGRAFASSGWGASPACTTSWCRAWRATTC